MNHAMDAPRPFTFIGELANTGGSLNIRIYLRSSAADCFFQGHWYCADVISASKNESAWGVSARLVARMRTGMV